MILSGVAEVRGRSPSRGAGLLADGRIDPGKAGALGEAGAAAYARGFMRSRLAFPTVALVACILWVPPSHAVLSLGRLVPAGTHEDSTAAALHAAEARDRGAVGAAAAFHLGAWHLARGEYGQARAAYLRAAQRLTGDDRHWARIGAARAALALGAPAEARSAAADALRGGPTVRAAARMASAQALELEGDKPRALELYSKLLADQPGEIGASALERVAVLHQSLKHTADAAEARARLQREYPASPEAARLQRTPPSEASGKP